MVNTITVFKNAASIKFKNKRILVIKPLKKKIGDEFQANNLIHIKSLVKETGESVGARCTIAANGKIKETLIGLSDEALFNLHVLLNAYFKNEC